jgi:N-acetylmuramoyl-L-alanine amidase
MLITFLTLTVVIDPGHGGSNTGAPGRHGALEKQVTLAIARALEKRLASESVDVVLTRDRDEYLTLRERSRRANAAHADVFVSLHTNASVDHGRRGVETYALSREAGDVEARRAARRVGDGAAALLADLGLLEARRQSVSLAQLAQKRLVEARGAADSSPRGPAYDRGAKLASFDVLAGVRAAAVLVEVGFIDHPVEGVELQRPDVQERIAGALAEAIFDWAARAHPQYAEVTR